MKFNFNTKAFNDGKEKYQSHEFSIAEDHNDPIECGLYLIGYGADAQEAKLDCMEQLDQLIADLIEFRKTL